MKSIALVSLMMLASSRGVVDAASASTPAQCNQSVALAKRSSCPKDRWLDRISPIIAEPRMVMINIGANKGFSVNSFLKRFQRGWSTTNAAWHGQYTKGGAFNGSCGACLACKTEVTVSDARADVYAVAVELAGSNSKMLKQLFKYFKVPGEVIHAAASEQPGVASVFNNIPLGHEGFTMGKHYVGKPGGEKPNIDYHSVIPMVSVDQIVAERKLMSIDLLSVDAEGHDAPILRGALNTLKNRLVKVVEFEYHKKGAWATEKLDDTISMLRRFKYTCFWQLNNGKLSPFFKECSAAYEFKEWSNVVCATKPNILQAFSELELLV